MAATKAKKTAPKKPASKKAASEKSPSASFKKATAKTEASATKSNANTGNRWTDEQRKLLLETVERARTAQEGFQAVAKELGKSRGTVQAQYYGLMRKAGKGRKPAAKKGSSNGASIPQGGTSTGRLERMSTAELAGLIQRATSVLVAKTAEDAKTLERVRSLL